MFKFAIPDKHKLSISKKIVGNVHHSLLWLSDEFSKQQSMRNLVCRRSMSDKTCLQLVEILGLPVTMTRNFCEILL